MSENERARHRSRHDAVAGATTMLEEVGEDFVLALLVAAMPGGDHLVNEVLTGSSPSSSGTPA